MRKIPTGRVPVQAPPSGAAGPPAPAGGLPQMPAGVPACRRGRYGIDAPFVPVLLVMLGIGLLAVGAVTLAGGGRYPGAALLWLVWDVLAGLVLVGSAAVYLHTTLRGKFTVWSEVIAGLGLRGHEQVLDMGCGRGAVLVLLAQRLESGRAVGMDLWRGVDQSGNTAIAAQANAQAEGVAERVEVRTGDMTAMPFGDAEFDLVVSSMAVHNITGAAARAAALEEAVRVLRPGGRLALVDFRHTRDYENVLAARGVSGLRRRGLGWRFWYGGPWTGATLITGTKPAFPLLFRAGCTRNSPGSAGPPRQEDDMAVPRLAEPGSDMLTVRRLLGGRPDDVAEPVDLVEVVRGAVPADRAAWRSGNSGMSP